MGNKTPIDLLAGGINIVMCLLSFLVPFAVINEVLYSNFANFSYFWAAGQYEYASITLFILGVAALVLNVMALIEARRREFSMVGSIIGIIASLITIFSGIAFSLVTMVLYVLAAIFVLREKHVVRKAKFS